MFSQTISPFVDRLMTDIWQACQSTDAIIAHSALFWTYDLAQKLDVPYFLACYTPQTPTKKYPVAMGSGKSMGGLLNYFSYSLSSLFLWQIFRKPVNQWLQNNLDLPSRSFFKSPFADMRNQKVPFLYAYNNYVLPKPKSWRKIEQQELTVESLSVAINDVVNNTQMRDRATQLGKQIRSENGVANAIEVIKNYL